MFAWLISYGSLVGHTVNSSASGAEQFGATIGGGIGITFILIVWGLGAVITGLLALLTRGSKTIVRRQG